MNAQTSVARNDALEGITAVAWYAPTEMSFAQWTKHGRRLGVMGRNAGWWIGDWLSFGNTAYGERYVRAAKITGFDVKTLRNMVYVATHVDPSRRRDDLSWSHHAEVVVLDEDEQERWLGRAAQEGLSVRDLRQAIQDTRRGRKGAAEQAAPSSRAAGAGHYHQTDEHSEPVVCPYCGQNVQPADEQ